MAALGADSGPTEATGVITDSGGTGGLGLAAPALTAGWLPFRPTPRHHPRLGAAAAGAGEVATR